MLATFKPTDPAMVNMVMGIQSIEDFFGFEVSNQQYAQALEKVLPALLSKDQEDVIVKTTLIDRAPAAIADFRARTESIGVTVTSQTRLIVILYNEHAITFTGGIYETEKAKSPAHLDELKHLMHLVGNSIVLVDQWQSEPRESFASQEMLKSSVTDIPQQIKEQTSAKRSILTEPNRELTKRGRSDFEKYLVNLRNGSAVFSLKNPGRKTAERLGYGEGFAAYYDVLLHLTNKKIEIDNTIHISEVIAFGEQLIAGTISKLLPDARIAPEYRTFSDEGREDFAQYLSDLESGKAVFHLRYSGIRAAAKYDFGVGFPDFYDELYDACKAEINSNGSVHISKIIGFAKEINLTKGSVEPKIGGNSNISGDGSNVEPDRSKKDNSIDWAKKECSDLGFKVGEIQHGNCVLSLLSFSKE